MDLRAAEKTSIIFELFIWIRRVSNFSALSHEQNFIDIDNARGNYFYCVLIVRIFVNLWPCGMWQFHSLFMSCSSVPSVCPNMVWFNAQSRSYNILVRVSGRGLWSIQTSKLERIVLWKKKSWKLKDLRAYLCRVAWPKYIAMKANRL